MALILTAASFGLAGCSLGDFGTSSTASSTLPTISGNVHGGQQPVSGEVIQLYAASTTTSKGASTPLISRLVTSNASGEFSFTGDYTCPTPSTLVYLTATGEIRGMTRVWGTAVQIPLVRSVLRQRLPTGGLNELDPTGKSITPNNAQTDKAGHQLSGNNVGENLATDAYGNYLDCQRRQLPDD